MAHRFSGLLSLTLFFVALYTVFAVNNRPIIGVTAQPSSDQFKSDGDSYIAASYIKFLESGGARVVPIMDFWSDEELMRVLPKLNGILFPGGGTELNGTKYMDFQQKIYNYVVKENMRGNFYPLWGTCLGFQSIANAAAGYFILGTYDSWNMTMPLKYTSDFRNSQLFGSSTPENIIQLLGTKPITFNNHMHGVSAYDFMKNPTLKNDYHILALNEDRKGSVFISAFEHRYFPIYASQFHPEKLQFEWHDGEIIDHTMEGIQANAYFSQFFVEKARQSRNKFPTLAEEWDSLIYNYPATFRYLQDKSFVQVYYFSQQQEQMKKQRMSAKKNL